MIQLNMTVLNMECLQGLRLLPSNYADSIVTDPPYELTSARPGGRSEATRGAVMGGFMGLAWDSTGIAFSVELWREALRVLKPGGHLLAFSGARTYHRMACAIEDAGFEVRDQIMWVYGSGFPKSRNLDGEWEGWGTALKPAHEPICMARKPLAGTVAANVLTYGTGALNIDACRVHSHDSAGYAYQVQRMTPGADQNRTGKTHQEDVVFEGHTKDGRWPANLIHDGSDEVLAAFPDAPGQLADASSSSSRKTQNTYGAMRRGRGGEPSANSENCGDVGFKMKPGTRRTDVGSAARFFYCAKASKTDRGEGNTHPTVKPTALMQHLCRLVTPPGGLVVDLFTGSGSTWVAAKREGFRFLGFELQAEYCAIAERRANA